ncbi:MAG TPA: type II secretion system F family protein [Gaiellaceae bacterium]|nr:type II secretion system F family protein [Gaiellaceae bacterium]
MVLLAIIAVALLAFAVVLVMSALLEPRLRRSAHMTQIEAYGYAGTAQAAPGRQRERQSAKKTFDDIANSLGDLVAGSLLRVREDEIQRELIAAGYFNIGARRFLGYRAISAIVLPICAVWFVGLLGGSAAVILVGVIIAIVIGWIGPSFYVHRRAAQRLQKIDQALPALIDLLVVTLEAGVAFTGAMRMAAQRLEGPLGEEIRLTIQEQSLGLSTLEALENWLKRCDTPSVRSFVRAMVQGDRLGVSIGQILRNQAIEMRARQKATIEERAQKAPVKILFPLVTLIFPAMFVIILGPALFEISKGLHG